MSDNSIKRGINNLINRMNSAFSTNPTNNYNTTDDILSVNQPTTDNDSEQFSQSEEHLQSIQVPEESEYNKTSEEQPSVNAKKASTGLSLHIKNYRPAPTALLNRTTRDSEQIKLETKKLAQQIESVLEGYNIEAKVISITLGPSLTRFELTVPPKVKISKILSIKNELQLQLAVKGLDIIAPIPGKNTIGVDIENNTISNVGVRELVETDFFHNANQLTTVLGRDQLGKPLYCDFSRIDHLLITGNNFDEVTSTRDAMICGILCKSNPESVRMIIIDTQIVDLIMLSGIPHLIIPIVNKASDITQTVNWIMDEINRRQKLLSYTYKRTIDEFNELAGDDYDRIIPHIFLFINTTYDWDNQTITNNSGIDSLLTNAASVGIHVIACARANIKDRMFQHLNNTITTKVAFAAQNKETSKAVLGNPGMETLHGHGDLYYLKKDSVIPTRGIGARATTKEITILSEYLRNKYGSHYYATDKDNYESAINKTYGSGTVTFEQAVDVVMENGKASVSVLQRRLGIGYSLAGRLIDEMEKNRIVGPYEGSAPRKVLITKSEWDSIKNKNNH